MRQKMAMTMMMAGLVVGCGAARALDLDLLIPKPQQVVKASGNCTVPETLGVDNYFQDPRIEVQLKKTFPGRKIISGKFLSIRKTPMEKGDEASEVTISLDGIEIRSAAPAGAFYALKTLEQLARDGVPLPCGTIRDWPALGFRGVHQPSFRWVEGGTSPANKAVTYDNTLYDGDEPIGFFWKDRLLFFEYKLIPGVVCGYLRNRNFHGGISLYAHNQYWGEETLNIKEFKVDTDDPTHFVMHAKIGQRKTGEKDDAQDIDATLEVAWESRLMCYAWTITKKMTVLDGQVIGAQPFIEFEDTYFMGLDGLYRYFIWKSSDGNLYRMPLNQDMSQDKYGWRYAKDGFWVACLNENMNPALEWLNGHGEDIATGVCWRAQDLHDYWLPKVGGFKAGDMKTIKYRLVNYPYEKAKECLDKSVYRDLPGDFLKDFPQREWPLTKFEKNLYRVEKVSELSVWLPYHQPCCNLNVCDDNLYRHCCRSCVVDKTCGYDDKFSLKIDASDGGVHSWHCMNPDYEPTSSARLIKGKIKFTFMVKTEKLNGYARLVYKSPSSQPLSSEKISGTQDWTKVVLEVPEDYGKRGGSDLYFEVKGNGIAWLDNLLQESDAPVGQETKKQEILP